MKVQIKTKFWEEKDHLIWINRLEKYVIITLILTIMNMAYFLFNSATVMMIINLFFWVSLLIMLVSKAKWEKSRNWMKVKE